MVYPKFHFVFKYDSTDFMSALDIVDGIPMVSYKITDLFPTKTEPLYFIDPKVISFRDAILYTFVVPVIVVDTLPFKRKIVFIGVVVFKEILNKYFVFPKVLVDILTPFADPDAIGVIYRLF